MVPSDSWRSDAAQHYRATARTQRLLTLGVLVALVAACGTILFGERAPTVAVAAPVAGPIQPMPVAAPPQLPRTPPGVAARPEPEPVAEVQVAAPEFERLMSERVTELGSLSIGAANRGFLFNAVQMPEGPLWEVVEPKYSWGTETTVRALSVAVKEVNRHYPETPRLFIGHLSRERGGWLRPHRSHQSGRDVDLGFFYLDGPNWYKQATPENLDVPRTWALLSALFKATPVEYAFVDRSLHPALREEATRIGESEHFLGEVFDGDVRVEPILRHARGHRDHMHVRFASPAAVDNARRAVAHLGAKARRWQTLRSMLEHRARQQKTD